MTGRWQSVSIDGEALPGTWSVRLAKRSRGGPDIGLHGDLWTVEHFAAWQEIAGRLGEGPHDISHPFLSMAGIRRVVMLPGSRTVTPVDGICRVTIRCTKAEA